MKVEEIGSIYEAGAWKKAEVRVGRGEEGKMKGTKVVK